MGETFLTIDNVTKSFAQTTVARNVDIAIDKGEFVSFLGPSGCGKTTTLRMVAGFEGPTTGRILIDGKDVTNLKPNQRNIGMVFQSYALFPNMTVAQNIAFGLKVAGASSDAIASRVKEMLGIIKLPEHGGRYPFQLSGGQQQRVSIARALVYQPSMLLLDEPLANLDAKLRVQMREELRALQRRLGITTIYVTHDQEEATAISDRLAVFNHGRLVQLGTPEAIYACPQTLFVADFIGRANFLPARLDDRTAPQGGVTLSDGTRLAARRQVLLSGDDAQSLASADDAVVMVRPEHLALHATEGEIACQVQRVQLLGGLLRYSVSAVISAQPILVETTRPLPGIAEGSQARLSIPAADAIVYRR